MKTRTLLLLSVATALMILVAGGVLLLQLSGQDATTETSPIGMPVRVGDAEITVSGSSVDGSVLRVDVEIGGVDDPRGVDAFALVTGDQRLNPITTPADGRCDQITDEFTDVHDRLRRRCDRGHESRAGGASRGSSGHVAARLTVLGDGTRSR